MGPLIAVSQAVFTKEPVEGLVAASADTAMVLMRGYITYNLLVVLLSQLILQLIYVNIVLYYRDLGLLGRNVDMLKQIAYLQGEVNVYVYRVPDFNRVPKFIIL